MRRTAITLLVLLALTGTAAASSGVGAASAFSLGTGARDLALAGANLATSDLATSPFWNPSRLAIAPQLSLTGFHSRLYDSDISYDYLGVALPTLDLGGFGLGIFWQSSRDIERRDASNLLLGEFDDNQFSLHLAYGRSLSSYNLGVSATIGHHTLDDYRVTSSPGVNLSAGRQFALRPRWLDTISVAVTMKNLIKEKVRLDVENFGYPLEFAAGISFGVTPSPHWQQKSTISASITKSEFSTAKWALGLEHDISKLIYLRGGLNSEQQSIGAGLRIRSFTIDYALIDRDLGSLHMVSISAGIGKTITERKNARLQSREAEFNDRMSNHIATRNLQMVEQLVSVGNDQLSAGDLSEACGSFERALFVARSAELDTLEIQQLATGARDQLDAFTARAHYTEYLDSSYAKLAVEDYLAASYFANLALSVFPGSDEAAALRDRADEAMQEHSARNELMDEQLLRADSLLSIGKLGEARAIIRALDEYAPGHSAVGQLLVRLDIERWREIAYLAHADENYETALIAIDSVRAVLPKCIWCETLRGQIEKQRNREQENDQVLTEVSSNPLSPELQRELKMLYQGAQEDFEQGELTAAMAKWEKVERLAPGYLSVRKYLVAAYKFVGIDLYSQKRRQEALDMWNKAIMFEPDNSEIRDYINRATSELSRLEEFSYER